jgi:signal transduction histidine kinase
MDVRRIFRAWIEKVSIFRSPNWSFRPHLRAKVTLGVVLPLVVILGVFTLIENARHREVVVSNLSLLAAHSGQVIENNLRQQMLKSDFEELQITLDTIGENVEFRVIYLLDTSGKVIFAPNGQDKGAQLDNRLADCQPCHRLAPDERPASIVVTASDGQRVFRSMHPIENGPECSQCHDPQQRLIGLLLTDILMAPLEAPLSEHLRESLLWWVGTILVTVLVVNLAVHRLVLRRLARFTGDIADFAQGRLSPSLPDEQVDEIGQLAGSFKAMAVQVDKRNTEIRSLSDTLQRQSAQRGELLKRLITAQEDERKRVARELHDELGQALSGLAFQTEAIGKLIPTDTSGAILQLDQTRRLINATTEQMYNLIMDLRPSILDDLGLPAALHTHARRLLSGCGIDFQLETDGLIGRLPPELETVLYRIFQEALTNVVRHAQADQIRVMLACQGDTFYGSIVDNGRGFEPEGLQLGMDNGRGLGLLGMQERVAIFNGVLQIQSEPGLGTSIYISVPIMEIDRG